MGAARHEAHRRHDPRRQHDRVRTGLELVDDLFDGHDRTPRREHRLLLHADEPPQLHVALAVGLLCVDDGDVELDRPHRGERLAGERARDGRDRGCVRHEVGADVATEDAERQTRGARDIARGHARVAVLLDLERPWPAVLDRIAEAVERPHARVAAPREDHLLRAARTDQLVVDDVRRHPHEGEVAAALPDDLVPGGVRDEVGEPLERDGVAVVDVALDGFSQRLDGRARPPQKSIGYCGARPVAMSSGRSAELFSHTSSIERLGE